MKDPGISRPIDGMGRVVIPKELRRAAKLNDGDRLEIYTEGDAIVLRKFEPTCLFCKSEEDLVHFRNQPVCRSCASALFKLSELSE